jgi:hypothetical protein
MFIFHHIINMFISPISPIPYMQQRHFLFLFVFRHIIDMFLSPISLQEALQSLQQR